MKASVKYSGGLMLLVPKTGHAPMLFLEWLSVYNAGANILHKVINDTDNTDPGSFKIRLNVTKELYEGAALYINNNM